MDQSSYHIYQQNLAFEKELNILRNDFYYQLIDSQDITLVDFMYQPLDIISGDAYTARRLSQHKTFYLIIDGMGKGISASLTSMIMTTFINHIIDKMIEYDSFSFDLLIRESMEFIRPILLEEEAVAVDFICFDAYFQKLYYAKFAMPYSLLQKNDKKIVKLKSNNPPLSKWTKKYEIDTYDVKDVVKFLFYSDGLVENKTKNSDVYAKYIDEDFKHSFTKEEFKAKLFEKLDTVEDDLTLIFLNKLSLEDDNMIAKNEFATKLNIVEEANEWYSKIWESLSQDMTISVKAGIVFNELFMNAYEHGNLGIDATKKHLMLEDDTYIDTLLELEQSCSKYIKVEVYKVHNIYSEYIVTEIIDEGKGFDTQLLSTIFRNSQMFNGRGVFVSRKNSMGIYYNSKGNRVLFLNKI
jgi:hypothetical protein